MLPASLEAILLLKTSELTVAAPVANDVLRPPLATLKLRFPSSLMTYDGRQTYINMKKITH